jgi:hypothetical protein
MAAYKATEIEYDIINQSINQSGEHEATFRNYSHLLAGFNGMACCHQCHDTID